MRADEIAEGAYVRPRKLMLVNGRPQPKLYEIEKVRPGGALLRNCSVGLHECLGSYGTMEVTRSHLVDRFVLVVPEADVASLAA